jgi:CRP/FNR family transcriptional regulator, cyclic AMP receptor protein
MKTAVALGEVLAGRGRKVALKPNQTLFREGDNAQSVYVCLEGRVNLVILTPSGRELILGVKVPLQIFGELSALDGGPRSATAIAMEPSVVAQLSGDEFLDELSRSPSLSFEVLRELAGHLRTSNSRAMARCSEHLTERVAHLLIELGEKFNRHGEVGSASKSIIELPITQDEIAAWVGCTREAVTRSLTALRSAGVIETGRNRIVLCDHDGLVRFTSPAYRGRA